MHPVQHMRRATADERARGGIGPHLVNLSPEAEIAESRAAAE